MTALSDAVRSFKGLAYARDWHVPACAENECTFASDAFLHELAARGIHGRIEHYEFWRTRRGTLGPRIGPGADLDRYPWLGPYEFWPQKMLADWHWAVRVGDVIVDWTARQFDPRAPFPAIWRDAMRCKVILWREEARRPGPGGGERASEHFRFASLRACVEFVRSRHPRARFRPHVRDAFPVRRSWHAFDPGDPAVAVATVVVMEDR